MEYFSRKAYRRRFSPRVRSIALSFSLLAAPLITLPTAVFAEEKKEPPKEGAPAEAEAVVLEPGSDYVCQSDISYTWRPSPPPLPKPDPSVRPQTVPTPAPPPEPVKEFFTAAGEQGMNEKEVRERLIGKLPEIRRQASDACRSAHQDFSVCVSSRLRATYDQYVKLDFAARRAMIDAIDVDCQQRMGTCLSDEASEVRCYVNRSPDAVPKVEAEAGKEKEKKK